jgi:flagellar hook-basal body complex protein FliE
MMVSIPALGGNTADSTKITSENLLDFQKAQALFDTEKQLANTAFDGVAATGKTQPQEVALNANGLDFGQSLKSELQRVNQLQQDAHTAIQDYAAGGDTPVHQVMLAVNKAELSLQLATQVRNKMVMAYQEVSRMQI